MASFRSHLLNHITRWLMRWVFRKREHPTVYRAKMLEMDKRQARPLPPGITTEDVAGPVPGRWIRNAESAGQVLLYLPGGAFVLRVPEAETAMLADICRRAGCEAFVASYRLAPEHPFPAGPEDCLTAYRSLLRLGHKPEQIVVMGASAGGNLALVLLHQIQRTSLPMPSGAVGLSPITDFAQVSATWRLNHRRDPMYFVQGVVNPIRWYLRNAELSLTDPLISPYYGDFSGFPPLLFMVGGLEALTDDSIGMARKAIDHGIPAKVVIWNGMPHVFLLNDILPEASPARTQVAAWLKSRRPGSQVDPPANLERDAVELFDFAPFTGRITSEHNDIYRKQAMEALRGEGR